MSTKAPQDPFQTIDPTALAQVSGGAAAPTDNNEAVLSALTGILDSIESIASNQNQGGFGPTEMMMFMMMLQNRNQPQAVLQTSGQPFTHGNGIILK